MITNNLICPDLSFIKLHIHCFHQIVSLLPALAVRRDCKLNRNIVIPFLSVKHKHPFFVIDKFNEFFNFVIFIRKLKKNFFSLITPRLFSSLVYPVFLYVTIK